jgi:hypothetical protein
MLFLPLVGDNDGKLSIDPRSKDRWWPMRDWIVAALAGVLVSLEGRAYAQALAPASQAQVVMPDADKIVLLLRTSLLTLNDALQTGNFTVLRDIGAPGFREANSAARLSQSFSDLAFRGIDLSPVSVIAPLLTEPPHLDRENGVLRLKGYFPGKPVQINFEMLYQAVQGRWRLFGLSVQPGPPTSQLPQTSHSEGAKNTETASPAASKGWGQSTVTKKK